MQGNRSDAVRNQIDALSAFIDGKLTQGKTNCDHGKETSPCAGEGTAEKEDRFEHGFHDFLQEFQAELKRLKRTFETRRFFVVTIGALKAGKSTLINALTGFNVSPAGTGAETTKKCSVIMAADPDHPEGITLYRYEKTTQEQDSKNSCEQATRFLMNYFKGICEWDENKPYKRRTDIPLT